MKPRILVVGPTPPPYHGGSVFTSWVLTRLQQEEFSLVHLDIADRRGLRGIGHLDLTNVYLALRHCLEFVWSLLSQKPAVVYLQLSQALWPFLRDCLFLFPAILLHRKVVVHLHGSIFRSVYEAWPVWIRVVGAYALARVSRAIVLSEQMKGIFVGLVPEERIVAIPNGIDTSLVGPSNSRPKLARGAVLYIGALSAEKGVLDILEAVPEVKRNCPGTRFVFAGEWHEPRIEIRARQLISQAGPGSDVVFSGPVAGGAKQRLFREASMLVLPSYHEGQPIVVLEAMAASLPVVATNVGCIAETMGDGTSGLVIEKGNPRQLAAAIVRLLQDHTLRERLGKAGRQRCEAVYSLDRTIASLRQLFLEVLAED